jgi:hypothetical protein
MVFELAEKILVVLLGRFMAIMHKPADPSVGIDHAPGKNSETTLKN